MKMSFGKVQRSYATPPKTRLATFREVEDNLESIKQQGLLEGRDVARLLDGWISGPDFKFEMGNNFRYCMGYMIVIQVYPEADGSSDDSGKELYESVRLSEEGKQVALLLCAYDWNFEVVYWLLNSWDTAERMDPGHVRNGRRILFNHGEEMSQFNKLINDLARNLCQISFGSEKANNKKLTLGSVTEELYKSGTSVVGNLTEDQREKLLGRTFTNYISLFSQEVGNYWFGAFETQTESANDLWDLMWEHFCTFSVAYSTKIFLGILINKWLNDSRQDITSQRNFILSGSILYYILHVHLKFLSKGIQGKRGTYNIRQQFLRITCNTKFNVLDEVLLRASEEGNVIIMKKMLDCGAHAMSQIPKKRTALHVASYSIMDDDKMTEVVQLLMKYCVEKEKLVNAQDEDGKTVLHSTALKGKEGMCKLLLNYGAKPDTKDKRGRLPLHYAVEESCNGAIEVLLDVPAGDAIKMLNRRDCDRKSPFDLAVYKNNIEVMTMVMPILKKQFKSYFDKVDTSKLLRHFAKLGNTDIVRELLKNGARPLDVDEEGKTALHCAAMCENYSRGLEIIGLLLEECKDFEKLISKCDKKGKTALHVLASVGVLYVEMEKFEGSVFIKDKDGQTPLYDATEGKLDEPYTIDVIASLMHKKGIYLDELIDNTGLTPLHVAASLGKVFQVDCLLRWSKNAKTYVRRADYLGQTALHKAAQGGYADTIKVLLHWRADPLLERDCDGKTALHYAVQAKTGDGDKIALMKLLLEKCGSKEREYLFLWASAAGIGTADQNIPGSSLKTFLQEKKKNLTNGGKTLLQMAACMGHTEMTKELLGSGGQLSSIQNEEWKRTLEEKEKSNVKKVLDEIKKIAEQGNDRPSISDNLGRADFANGLAAFLLNPYLKPPNAIGVSGSWGMGKSSLMVQTEIILLKTAAQSALLQAFYSQEFKLSKVGQNKYNKIKSLVGFLRHKPTFCTTFIHPIIEKFRWIGALIHGKSEESQVKQSDDSLVKFLSDYKPEYHKIFKSLAAVDSSDMFIPTDPQSYSRSDSPLEGCVPPVITVQYNAWKYRNDSEALAGMAVEITKEMEGIMTEGQWLTTCWRNTWRKNKQAIFISVIFPCLLAIFLAGAFTWIVWVLLDRYNVKEAEKLKYGSLPATIVIMVWTVVKSVMSTVTPVSTQLMNYISFPDHTEKLGYQERVISDITFLKGEIRRRPFFLCTAATFIWHLITRNCMVSYLCSKFCQEDMKNAIPACTSITYTSNYPRIIVFVDDLDRCEESVILQVLSAVNLVLAVCEISAVVGMDKSLIRRAILKMYGDESLQNGKELVDKYLQKIIQLPLDLPDPSEDESKTFLDRQLGVFRKQGKDKDGELEADGRDDRDDRESEDKDYFALFSTLEIEEDIEDLAEKLEKKFSLPVTMPDAIVSSEAEEITPMEGDPHPQTDASDQIAIEVTSANDANAKCFGETHIIQSKEAAADGTDAGEPSSSPSIQIRKMLFVRYSEGEQDAFRYFETMDTDWRKLPRHWKCLLYYHRLIWYILSSSNEARSLNGWQVQLITWIFICWEWEDNMNILIENWERIGLLKNYNSDRSSGSGGPSLRAIVEDYIENGIMYKTPADTGGYMNKTEDLGECGSKEIMKEIPEQDMKGTGDCKKSPEAPEDIKVEGISKDMDVSNDVKDDEESNRREINKLVEVVKNQTLESNNRGISEKLDDVVKTLRNEIEKALRELEEVKKEIRDLKETKQHKMKKNKIDEEQKKENNWKRMNEALKRYDVSMEGIKAFQKFRVYCEPRYLPWPLSKKGN